VFHSNRSNRRRSPGPLDCGQTLVAIELPSPRRGALAAPSSRDVSRETHERQWDRRTVRPSSAQRRHRNTACWNRAEPHAGELAPCAHPSQGARLSAPALTGTLCLLAVGASTGHMGDEVVNPFTHRAHGYPVSLTAAPDYTYLTRPHGSATRPDTDLPPVLDSQRWRNSRQCCAASGSRRLRTRRARSHRLRSHHAREPARTVPGTRTPTRPQSSPSDSAPTARRSPAPWPTADTRPRK